MATSFIWTMEDLACPPASSFDTVLSLSDLPPLSPDDTFAYDSSLDPTYASPSLSDSTCNGDMSDSETSSAKLPLYLETIKPESLSPLPMPTITTHDGSFLFAAPSPPPAPLSLSTPLSSSFRCVQAFPSFTSNPVASISSSSSGSSSPACLLLSASTSASKSKGVKRGRKPNATTNSSSSSSVPKRSSLLVPATGTLSVTDDSDDEVVRLMKKEKNKECAKNYRKRRKEQVEKAHSELEQLRSKCAQQQSRIAGLEAENKALKDQVAFLQSLVSNRSSSVTPSAAMFVLFSCFVFCVSGIFLSTSSASSMPALMEDTDVSVNGFKGRSLLSTAASDESRCLLEGVDAKFCQPLPANHMSAKAETAETSIIPTKSSPIVTTTTTTTPVLSQAAASVTAFNSFKELPSVTAAKLVMGKSSSNSSEAGSVLASTVVSRPALTLPQRLPRDL